jgi:diacylglycerol kinase
MKANIGYFRRLPDSLRNSINGIWYTVSREKAMHQELVLGAICLTGLLLIGAAPADFFLFSASLAVLLTVETPNTSIELLANVVREEYCASIKNVKDVASGAVSIALVVFIDTYAKPYSNACHPLRFATQVRGCGTEARPESHRIRELCE